LRRFKTDAFPLRRSHFRMLVDDGQHPTTLFIGCSDSRLVPYLLTGTGPGELFLVRNVGAFVPPYDGYLHDPPDASGVGPSGGHTQLEAARRWVGFHGTAAAIEFAVLNLQVARIVVCGHSHCGGIRALYGEVDPRALNLAQWLELGREAVLPVAEPGPEVLRRTEQRAVVLQLERLMDYPMVRERVEEGQLSLHGWHYVIEDGEVHVFDVLRGGFVPASVADNAGTGPYAPSRPDDRELTLDASGIPMPVGGPQWPKADDAPGPHAP
jgi:carbonic anhydrase